MSYRAYFKCPLCGGNLVNPAEKDIDDFVIKQYEKPTCENCKKEFVIRILPDFSYEVIEYESDEELYKMMEDYKD